MLLDKTVDGLVAFGIPGSVGYDLAFEIQALRRAARLVLDAARTNGDWIGALAGLEALVEQDDEEER
jgi:hypothetical protein